MSDEEKVYTTVDAVNLASDGNVNEFKDSKRMYLKKHLDHVQ